MTAGFDVIHTIKIDIYKIDIIHFKFKVGVTDKLCLISPTRQNRKNIDGTLFDTTTRNILHYHFNYIMLSFLGHFSKIFKSCQKCYTLMIFVIT